MLGEFLKRECANGAPWNCSTMPADWCLSLGHPDFAAEWRSITEPTACEAVPQEAGGLLALWERGIGDGLPVVTGGLVAGDIAVVCLAHLEAGAIWTGERWAMRAARGLHFVDASMLTVVKAWRP